MAVFCFTVFTGAAEADIIITPQPPYEAGGGKASYHSLGGISIGHEATIWAERATAIGSKAEVRANATGGVALGVYSVSDRRTASAGIYIASGAQRAEIDRVKYTVTRGAKASSSAFYDSGLPGVVAIGNDKITRQLTGLAAGIQDTDAVNVAQIKALDSVVSAVSNDVETKYTELGGKITANEKGIAKNKTDIATNKTGIADVRKEVKEKHSELRARIISQDKNITDLQVGDGLSAKYQKGSKNKLAFTDSGSAVKISNVADGSANSDAVNFAQLKKLDSELGGKITATEKCVKKNKTVIAKNTTDITNNAANITKNTTDITNNAANITKNTTDITNNAVNITKNTTDITDVRKSVDTKHAALSAMITSQDKNITYLQNDIGVLDELSVRYDGKAKDIVTLNKKADGTMGDAVRITNVANGEISRNSTDAVTGKQLWSLGDHMAKALGGTIKIVDGVVAGFSRDGGNPENGGSATSPLLLSTLYVNGKEEKTSNGNLSIVNGSNLEITHVDGSLTFNVSKTPEFERVQVGNVDISQDGIKMGGNSITGLANGGIYQGSTDAVNGGQLWNAYRRIDTINERVQIVGAHAAALSALHPVPYNPYEPTTFSAGFGMYRNEQSVAIGVFHYVRENMLVNVGLSLNTDGDTMGRAGISFAVGTGSKKKQPVLARDMVEMQKMMMAMQEEIRNLKDENMKNGKTIRELKEKEVLKNKN